MVKYVLILILICFTSPKSWSQEVDTLIYESILLTKHPEFKGGEIEMMKYFQKNIKYPLELTSYSDNSRVFIQFTVNKNGELSDFEILRSISKEIDDEYIRVLKNMPKWNPGEIDGIPVGAKMVIPIQICFR